MLKRYGRIIRQRTKRFCPRRSNRARSEGRPFALSHHSENSAYLLLAWGFFPYTELNGQHYFRLRRFIGAADPCLPGGVRQRQAISRIILGGAERRCTEQDIWQGLLSSYPTHVVRLGWKTPIGSNYDILYLPLSFTFRGFYADGLAKAFGERLLEALQRNTKLSWRLCPSTEGEATLEAAAFWLGAAFAYWVEIDLGIKTR